MIALARKRYHRRKEGKCMTEPRDYALKLAKLPDRIATIIGKSVAEVGDDFSICDEEALHLIRNLLLELDETVIQRNKNKRLVPRRN